ncbi:uncharacterized protein M437DRAFT_70480 [Aureobasidium melanogenum CBS 110374]|uniref:Uncharacterized protein n=1 Tax=Aureobasidium melanogenum (strain CBS 110374) TaxID=1043003 RepID=A0A074VBU5_AURM1|nr:uncharacterized protein M437DRAFT_70480 [Aureobasidium melanogenum CBS 110374]KEQ57828.1 hypothetical protein M437DRAFT_70480 [Aureobasidium melanogenum CBS 110374]
MTPGRKSNVKPFSGVFWMFPLYICSFPINLYVEKLPQPLSRQSEDSRVRYDRWPPSTLMSFLTTRLLATDPSRTPPLHVQIQSIMDPSAQSRDEVRSDGKTARPTIDITAQEEDRISQNTSKKNHDNADQLESTTRGNSTPAAANVVPAQHISRSASVDGQSFPKTDEVIFKIEVRKQNRTVLQDLPELVVAIELGFHKHVPERCIHRYKLWFEAEDLSGSTLSSMNPIFLFDDNHEENMATLDLFWKELRVCGNQDAARVTANVLISGNLCNESTE